LSFTVALVLALMLPARPAQAATYTVNSTDDVNDGACNVTHCSLREAINAANNPGPDTIMFNIPGAGVHTIAPLTALPALTGGGTTIDGYSQPGTEATDNETPATILIEIDGTNTTNQSGLYITSADNVVRGLAINRFDWDGIGIGLATATGNVIAGNHLGPDPSGTVHRGNGHSGVYVGLGATNNTIGGDEPAERNVLSGNEWSGVEIHGSGTTSNTVSGNYIGTQASSMAALGNTLYGVRIYGGAQNNTIGGDTAGERNVISGNAVNGVHIAGEGTTGNVVSGNYIGTTVYGIAPVGNAENGVYITLGAQNNVIGGDVASERNVISGNLDNGVYITGTTTMSNTISGNYIGSDANGIASLGNGQSGVYVRGGAQYNLIGGDSQGERNIISGNEAGVTLYGSGVMSNTVSGNYIGTDRDGTTDLGNALDGVCIEDGAQYNLIGGSNATPGGACTGTCNVISGNDRAGVWLYGYGVMSNTVSGNYIGTNAAGVAQRANGSRGIYIAYGAQRNIIGGDEASERNVISGNALDGIGLYTAGSNVISGNYIGTDASGSTDLGNARSGVFLSWYAVNNTIGGASAEERNVISGNGGDGIWFNVLVSDTVVSGNYIGTDANGTADLGNDGNGVFIERSPNNLIGGEASERNVIAYNGWNGVRVEAVEAIDNVITQNSIFANGLMGIDLREGANGGISAPVIATTTEGSVNVVGTACAGCTVEIFENSDADGEGETYVGDTTATAGGDFTVTVSYLTKPYLTATATDATDGTSEFSEVFTATVPVGRDVYLPIILKNH
jgi:CSLREA domain-containing protein